MLKLTMCPRKRAKKCRAIPHRLRLPTTNHRMDVDEPDAFGDQQDMLADNLHAMLKQEQSGKYICVDYLNPICWQHSAYQTTRTNNYEDAFGATAGTVPGPSSSRIDEYCREQIVEWSFRVVDYFRIDREVVAVSMNFLDRYLSHRRCDRNAFKLAATTTLHLAVKILYPCKLADLGILSDLSRGEFCMTDVCNMEVRVLETLNWNMHPPTICSICSIFLDFFFASRVVTLSSHDLDDIYDVASFFCELAICDYSFSLATPSSVCLACILNALEGMFGPETSLYSDIAMAARAFNIRPSESDLSVLRNRLWDLYERSEECAIHHDKFQTEEHSSHWNSGIFVKKASSTSSPVSVSAKPCHSATDFPTSTQNFRIRNESW